MKNNYLKLIVIFITLCQKVYSIDYTRAPVYKDNKGNPEKTNYYINLEDFFSEKYARDFESLFRKYEKKLYKAEKNINRELKKIKLLEKKLNSEYRNIKDREKILDEKIATAGITGKEKMIEVYRTVQIEKIRRNNLILNIISITLSTILLFGMIVIIAIKPK